MYFGDSEAPAAVVESAVLKAHQLQAHLVDIEAWRLQYR